jgi:rhodanese-related sulfurtransferase
LKPSKPFALKRQAIIRHPLQLFMLLMLLAVKMSPAAITAISQDTLESWITLGTTFDFILIDVRTPAETKTYGIIATDSCRPYNLTVSDGTLRNAFAQIPLSTPVVVYCQSGMRSQIAATQLDSAGFTHVFRMITGVNSWSYLKKDSSFVKPTSQLPQPSMRATIVSAMNRELHDGRSASSAMRPTLLVNNIVPGPWVQPGRVISLLGQTQTESFRIPGSHRVHEAVIVIR